MYNTVAKSVGHATVTPSVATFCHHTVLWQHHCLYSPSCALYSRDLFIPLPEACISLSLSPILLIPPLPPLWQPSVSPPLTDLILLIYSSVLFFRFYIWLKSYNICLSLSALIHLALYLSGPPVLLQMARSHPFLWLHDTHYASFSMYFWELLIHLLFCIWHTVFIF